MSTNGDNEPQFDYDVCLSFAGEDREYVDQTASELRSLGVRVFYDKYEEVELWGKDLYAHLHEVYSSFARYCVIFISQHYAAKLWTSHERKAAQARAFKENSEYILPARFDDTPIPGLPDTVGYVSLTDKTAVELARMIFKKLGVRQRANYLPPVPDRLFDALDAVEEVEQDMISIAAGSFFGSLRRMTRQERDLVFHIFLHACPAELPENVHINIDLLRRCTGLTPARIQKTMGQIASLGFESYLREDDETEGRHGRKEMLVVSFNVRSVDYDEEEERGTLIASLMVEIAVEDYCEEHGLEALHNLDFHQLASATFEPHSHEVAAD